MARGSRKRSRKISQRNHLVALRGRHQNRFLGDSLHAVITVVVPVAEENEIVVVALPPSNVPEESGRERSLFLEPSKLVIRLVFSEKHLLRDAPEAIRVTRPAHFESAHRDPVHSIDPRGVLVLPGDVVPRAGGQNLDVVRPREMLRHQPAMGLCASVDVLAVPLDYEGQTK